MFYMFYFERKKHSCINKDNIKTQYYIKIIKISISFSIDINHLISIFIALR